ncbi:MAG: cobyrinic acid a,c-diamide synthase [Candidatus Desulfovibrio kirbyi]|jgi:cobyrinic acid a,c-diamide synthase|uniref:Cobyrinic acid a,c-diamide synthase n=1 Tax=Candidatus Desulfovibrio kirbyi TaxID=2696086 RepID=A0A6L2R4M2_9BACT|nr:cobyrinate a,c-diamide synthase [Desulfovibrio sp.]GFH62404.1 MAG: cobyrinic acid a,c-diamide synthase [Candidatus Desulfovibrio kirbyi]
MTQTPGALSLPRLCVSSLSGGGGKTLLALGLTRALVHKGISVKPFKKGPDYIDAAWLEMAAQKSVSNLDPYFLSQARLRSLFAHAARAIDQNTLGLIEGNRGLYDGSDVSGSCSTAVLARALDCPVLLSVNCAKMTRTVAALVQGMTNFEPGLNFCGVVLNQVGSQRHTRILRQALEEYTDMPVLGALPCLSGNPLPERHMGIASQSLTNETAEQALETLAVFVREHMDVNAALAAARSAPPLPEPEPFWPAKAENMRSRVRIGYVRDAALWFYYQENLEALDRAGAELIRLSLLDAAPWPEIDGLYLGGGFPEDSARVLSASPRVAELARLADNGLAIYAECGGFMLLSKGIQDGAAFWPMSGVFPVTVRLCNKPQGLGYVDGIIVAKNPYFPVGLTLRGHEFHYSRCEWENQPPEYAMTLSRGTGMGEHSGKDSSMADGLTRQRVWASYTHIFAPALPCWAKNFVNAARTRP